MTSPESPAPLVRMVDVGLNRAGQTLLHQINFELARGEIHAVVGGNNTGKSVLCSLAVGEMTPSSGTVLLDGMPMPGLSTRRRLAAGIIKVPKTPQLFPHLTVAQNLVAGYRGSWWRGWAAWRKSFGRVERWLEEHDIRLDTSIQLSFVPREDWLFIQILGLLHRRPRLFVLDETLELLPTHQRDQIWPILQEQAENNGMAALWATQNLDDAMTYTNRISVMHEHRLLISDRTGSLDRLSLVRLCYSRLIEGGDTTLEQFHRMLCVTEAALRDLPTPVLVVDSTGVVCFANRTACDFFAVTEKFIMGMDLEALSGTSRRQVAELIQVAMDEAAEADSDVEWSSQPYAMDNEKRLADVRVRPVKDGDAGIGFMVVIEDVSERENLRRQLAMSENLASVGLLAAGVAHEVNNPLAIISNYNRYLRNKASGDGMSEAVEQIALQADKIKNIVQSLTAFTKGRPQGHVPVDMGALAAELCRLVRADKRTSGIQLDCSAGDGLLVEADPNEMRLVLLNLIRNALDALDEAVGERRITVSVSAHEKTEAVQITVADTGKGIALANPEQVFLPFVTTKGANGIHQGIGLSIVHQIISKYNGSITAENRVHGGCGFVILLPKWCPPPL